MAGRTWLGPDLEILMFYARSFPENHSTDLLEFPYLRSVLAETGRANGFDVSKEIILTQDQLHGVTCANEELATHTPEMRRRVVELQGSDEDTMWDYCPYTMNVVSSALCGEMYGHLLVERKQKRKKGK